MEELGRRNVVEARDRDVVGDAQAELANGAVGADGDVVVAGDDGVGRVRPADISRVAS